jgi:membrane protease YdiL (CAAX protease family)
MYSSGGIRRHPVLTFYVLTFAISWGGILVVVGHGGVPGNPAQLAKMIPVLIVAMLAGPATASILVTGVVYGRAGYRDLLSCLVRRAGIGWDAAAFLTAPLVLMAVPLALSLRSPDFIPRIFTENYKGSLLMLGFGAALAAGFFEELGWTGFVTPKLRLRFSAFTTGIIVAYCGEHGTYR